MEMPARPKMTVTCKKEFIAHTIFIYKNVPLLVDIRLSSWLVDQ